MASNKKTKIYFPLVLQQAPIKKFGGNAKKDMNGKQLLLIEVTAMTVHTVQVDMPLTKTVCRY